MEKKEDGPFATLFLWIGFIAGGAAGIEANDFMGMLIGAIILGAIGFWVGKQVDLFLGWLIFIVVAIISILINAAIRRFIWELIRAVANG